MASGVKVSELNGSDSFKFIQNKDKVQI